MKYFPAMCVDNFYSNPDEIRKFALEQTFYESEDGAWPGKRTKPIHEIDKNLFDSFTRKIFSIYFDLNFPINWVISSSFQLIEPYDIHKTSCKNAGWIHLDRDSILAGVIYLNPQADPDSGTSIYKLLDNNYTDLSYDKETNVSSKSKLYKNEKISDDEYEFHINRQNEAFQETIRFSNIYNRLITFDGTSYHGVRCLHAGNEPRLTQVFFVQKITSVVGMPLIRYSDDNFTIKD